MDLRNQNQGAATQTKKKRKFLSANPIMNRLSKIDEVATSEKAAGYGRISAKTIYFLLFTVAGLLVYLVMNATIFANQPTALNLNFKGFNIAVSAIQLGFFTGATVLAIITQIVAVFARGAIPVVGAIYSFCQGFIISFIVFTLLPPDFRYLGLLALAITIVVVLVMGILYATRIIKVTKKFQMVMFTLMAAMVGISIVTLIASFIPLTRPFVNQIMGNFGLSLVLSLLSVLIATLFLISDFKMIETVVENKMPAKYEWMAAFGLAFTILWIYVKVLEILIRILGNSRS